MAAADWYRWRAEVELEKLGIVATVTVASVAWVTAWEYEFEILARVVALHEPERVVTLAGAGKAVALLLSAAGTALAFGWLVDNWNEGGHGRDKLGDVVSIWAVALAIIALVYLLSRL